MKYTQIFRMLTIIGLILGTIYTGVKIYVALQPPAATSTSAPTAAPIPGKKTYTLTWSSEVVVNDHK